jgi:hypothetical protein
MYDEKTSEGNKVSGSCCGHHGMAWAHKSWLCWVIGAVVLMMVFCAGYKLGMLRVYLGGWGHMRGNYPYGNMIYRGGAYGGEYRGGMMGNWQYQNPEERLEDQVTSSLKQ